MRARGREKEEGKGQSGADAACLANNDVRVRELND